MPGPKVPCSLTKEPPLNVKHSHLPRGKETSQVRDHVKEWYIKWSLEDRLRQVGQQLKI